MENHHFKQVIQLQVSHVQICSITILDYRRVLISGAAHPKNHVFFGAHREWATLPRTNRMINESGYFESMTIHIQISKQKLQLWSLVSHHEKKRRKVYVMLSNSLGLN